MTKPKTTAEEILAGHRQGKNLVWVPGSSIEPLTNPIGLIEGEGSCLGLFDIHCPFHDADFIRRCLEVALAWKLPHLIIGGDLLDVSVYSKFGTDPNNTMETELALAEDLLESLCKHFDRVFYCAGNHEMRAIGKVLQNQVPMERFVRLFTPPSVTNLKVTGFEWVEMDSPLGVYLFAHPKSASVIAGRVPNMIAGRSCTDRHVVSGHGHLRSFGFADDGRRFAIDSGMCADPQRIAYAMQSRGNRPVMMQGAVLVKQGHPTLLYPGIDWEAVKKMYG